MNQTNNIAYFDLLNVICCLSVVMMHYSQLVHYTDISLCQNITDTIYLFAVPVFFMLSGATLFNYRNRYSTKTFFKRRINRTFIPFIFWSIIWFIICVFVQSKTSFLSLKGCIDGFINTRFNGVYWFFFPLFALYLEIPMLSLLAASKEGEKMLYFLTVILISFEAIINPLLKGLSIQLNSTFVNGIALPTLYGILGYILSTKDIDKSFRYILYGSSVILLATKIYLSTYYPDLNIWSLTDIATLTEASTIFVFIKYIKIPNNLYSIVHQLASFSFGVYLVHILILYTEKRLLFQYINVYSFGWRVPMALVTYLLSIGLVILLKKIPVIGKRIV